MSNENDSVKNTSDIEISVKNHDKHDSQEINNDSKDEKNNTDNLSNVEVSQAVYQSIHESLSMIQSQLTRIHQLLRDPSELITKESETVSNKKSELKATEHDSDSKVIEGVFEGQMMIGPDGRKYQVPPNYASKSKLVEGDILKLTITDQGSFVYKQIGPIERDRIVGTLIRDVSTGDFRVKTATKLYKVLTASVTYFKGTEGDEIIILVPKNSDSNWAAVENIIGTTQ